MFRLVPVRPMRKVTTAAKSEDIFDQFFDSFFNEDVFTPFNKLEKRLSGFMVDVLDDGDKYVIEADLPGFDKENVKIAYNDQQLTISAKREDEHEEKKDNYIRKERYSGEFKRSFYVDNIDPDNITAAFNNGVLKVVLSKQPLKNNTREIIID
jgi:HSP20 family protein